MSDKQSIMTLLEQYERALNHSDTDSVMKLYAADGVFMPQHVPSSVEGDAVRNAYEGVFKTIQLGVKFKIEEVQTVSAEWAFARTNSTRTVLVHATGTSSAEANQELFVMQKVGGEWKIARYCFSTTNPPRA